MAVDERRRKALHDALERALGPEDAATMMELVPRGDLSELVTKADLKAEVGSLRVEVGTIRAEMHSLARRGVQWTSGAVFAAATLAFTAGRLI